MSLVGVQTPTFVCYGEGILREKKSYQKTCHNDMAESYIQASPHSNCTRLAFTQ